VSLFRTPADYIYFFSKLASPGWIEPLLEEGRFASPPPAVREGDSIRFPGWPESEYLSRVAAKAPDMAARVLAEVPDTDNQRVHIDLVDVALQLSARDAAAWARRESDWVDRQQWLALLLPEKLGQLAAQLASSGELETALQLCRALFRALPDPRWSTEEGGKRPFFHPQPRGLMDGWEYRAAIDTVVPALAEHGGTEALQLFVNVLAEAIRLSTDDEHEASVDYSFIWRDTIEDASEHDTDLRDILIDAARELAVAVAKANGCGAVADILRSGGWDVFRRLELHAIRMSCLASKALVREAIFTPGAFSDPTIYHEYVLLLRDAFPTLAAEDQETILAWIEKGPDRDAMRDRHRTHTGADPSEDELQAWVEHWQRDRLSPLKDVLPPERRHRFDELVKRHGAPEFDFVQHKTSSGWVAERSPIDREQFAKFTAEELRKFLRDWTPTEGFDQPTRSGVVQNVAALGDDFFVSEAEHALEWRDLHPAYVAALLEGLKRAVMAGRHLPWTPVLELCRSVAANQATDWDARWAKMAVAQLLVDVFNSDKRVLPHDMKQPASDVIVHLLESELGSEENRISVESDYLTAAINSVSGKALEAAIRAAVWAKRSEVGEEGSAEWRLTERMPSIAGLLDRVVRPESGLPVDARAILGSQLGPMLWLDRAWMDEHRAQLFPTAEGAAAHRRAVWNTYLSYGRPYTIVVTLFSDQYSWSIEQLPGDSSASENRRDAVSHLAEHLMTYYWQGSLPLSDREGLVRRFYKRASAKTRRYALEFIGRSLRNSGDVPPETLALLRELVEWRLNVVNGVSGSEAKKEASGELQEYGWWFSSGKFQPDWALERLLDVLRLGVLVEPDHLVAEELVRLAQEFPIQVAETLTRMIDLSPPEFTVSGWREEAHELLGKLGKIHDARVQAFVASAVDTLLARGQVEFRGLMPA
jgi:hypothetical protein